MNVNPKGSERLVPPYRPGPSAKDIELAATPQVKESFELSPQVDQQTQGRPAFSSIPIEIVAACHISQESLDKLRSTANKAVAHFREFFGPVSQPLRFEVGGAALRTGYNFVDDTICFPDLGNLKNAGLDSEDIINHEIFHALLLDAYPDLPSPQAAKPGTVRLHEGLADFFAHQIQPDGEFGENYSIDDPYLRKYHNDLHISLAAGGHGQGNALTSMLLEQQVGSQEVRSFLEAGDFSLEGLGKVSPAMKRALEKDASLAVDETVAPYPHSSKGRYWLNQDVPLQLSFLPNQNLLESHADFHVVWTDKMGMPSKGYVFEETAPNKFSISGAPEASTEKVIARFYDGDRIVGFRAFYFGVKDEGSSESPDS